MRKHDDVNGIFCHANFSVTIGINEEVKRRTRVARLFPNEASCERLVTAVMAEIHDEWVSGKKYLTME